MQWFKKSLIRRIGLFLTVFIISIFFIYGFISIQLTSDFFEETSKTTLSKVAHQIATEIDKFIGENIVVMEQMKTNQDYFTVIKEIKSQNKKRLHPLFNRVTQELQAIQTSEKNINLAYIAIVQANDLITSDYNLDSKPDYNMSKRDWYIDTIITGDIHAPMMDNYNYLDVFRGEIFSGQSGGVEYADGSNDQYIAYVPTEKANWISSYGDSKIGSSCSFISNYLY